MNQQNYNDFLDAMRNKDFRSDQHRKRSWVSSENKVESPLAKYCRENPDKIVDAEFEIIENI